MRHVLGYSWIAGLLLSAGMANVCLMKSLQMRRVGSLHHHQFHTFRSPLPAAHKPTTPARCRPSCSSSSPRPSLDDVERLSRGEASKAKIGSRAVPHRLNADERKAYELAKKRGYLVRQLWTRQYPLSNTFRNYCDALGWPCLRVDQGPAGSLDTMVVDLTTMRLQELDLTTLQTQIRQANLLEFGSGSDSKQPIEVFEAEENAGGNTNEEGIDAAATLDQEVIKAGVLHFCVPRSEVRRLSQVVQDCCKMYALASTIKPLP